VVYDDHEEGIRETHDGQIGSDKRSGAPGHTEIERNGNLLRPLQALGRSHAYPGRRREESLVRPQGLSNVFQGGLRRGGVGRTGQLQSRKEVITLGLVRSPPGRALGGISLTPVEKYRSDRCRGEAAVKIAQFQGIEHGVPPFRYQVDGI
jgi:hypothetical protein